LIVCAILDEDKNYAIKLSDYLKKQVGLDMEVVVFTSVKSLEEFTKKNPIKVLIANENLIADCMKISGITKYITLGEEDMEASGYICKYQQAGEIYKKILEEIKENGVFKKVKNTQILSVYSPIISSKKTTLSLYLSYELAKNSKVLLLSFDEFSGFNKIFDFDAPLNFSDFLNKLSFDVSQNFSEIVSNFKGVDFLIPPICPLDISRCDTKEIYDAVCKIDELKIYDYIVLDLGNYLPNPWEFFNISTKVYMPKIDNKVGQYRYEEFKKYMENIGLLKFVNAIRIVDIKNDNSLLDDEKLYKGESILLAKILENELENNTDEG